MKKHILFWLVFGGVSSVAIVAGFVGSRFVPSMSWPAVGLASFALFFAVANLWPLVSGRLITKVRTNVPIPGRIRIELPDLQGKSGRLARTFIFFPHPIGFYSGRVALRVNDSDIALEVLPRIEQYGYQRLHTLNPKIMRSDTTVKLEKQVNGDIRGLELHFDLQHNVSDSIIRNKYQVLDDESVEIVLRLS